ncbi:hypothetical protein B0H14DRAFT_3428764 [Mycena olivaceomarginata]|nr:hypothetical protein B0H14DRAFT_3428764 [Mycena olivaceomarginata]
MGGDAFDCSQQADAPPSYNKDLITSNLADLHQTAKDIKNVCLVLPDPLAAVKGGVTLTTVFTALKAATKLGRLLADGLESGEDLMLNETAEDTLDTAKLCASA